MSTEIRGEIIINNEHVFVNHTLSNHYLSIHTFGMVWYGVVRSPLVEDLSINCVSPSAPAFFLLVALNLS